MLGGFFKDKSAKDRAAIDKISYMVLLLVIILAIILFQAAKEKPDPETNCFKKIDRKFAIILDKTDFIPRQTQVEIAKRAWYSVTENGQAGDLVSVYEITQNSLSDLTPVFSMCLPKMGKDSNELIEKGEVLDKKFKESFEKPLLDILSKNTGQAQNSPIAEAIADINLSDAMRDAEQGRIILFSDLMQHSSNVSTYKCQNAEMPIAQFRKSRQGAVEPRPLFKNVYVELHVIPRLEISELEAKCRATFWNWFFGNMESTSQAKIGLSMVDLPGAYGAIVPNPPNIIAVQP